MTYRFTDYPITTRGRTALGLIATVAATLYDQLHAANSGARLFQTSLSRAASHQSSPISQQNFTTSSSHLFQRPGRDLSGLTLNNYLSFFVSPCHFDPLHIVLLMAQLSGL